MSISGYPFANSYFMWTERISQLLSGYSLSFYYSSCSTVPSRRRHWGVHPRRWACGNAPPSSCRQRHPCARWAVLQSRAAPLPPPELAQPHPLFQGKDISELSALLRRPQHEGLLFPHPHALEKSFLPFHRPQWPLRRAGWREGLPHAWWHLSHVADPAPSTDPAPTQHNSRLWWVRDEASHDIFFHPTLLCWVKLLWDGGGQKTHVVPPVSAASSPTVNWPCAAVVRTSSHAPLPTNSETSPCVLHSEWTKLQ